MKMKDYKFTVVFTNHNYQEVYASNKTEAIILAQAGQIRRGLAHNVEFVKDEAGNVI